MNPNSHHQDPFRSPEATLATPNASIPNVVTQCQRTAASERPQHRNEDDSELMYYHDDTSLSFQSPQADISLVPQLPTPVIAPVDVSGIRGNLVLSTPERASKKRKADRLLISKHSILTSVESVWNRTLLWSNLC